MFWAIHPPPALALHQSTLESGNDTRHKTQNRSGPSDLLGGLLNDKFIVTLTPKTAADEALIC